MMAEAITLPWSRQRAGSHINELKMRRRCLRLWLHMNQKTTFMCWLCLPQLQFCERQTKV
ncbi:hypothetical protein Hanom_Chr16g01463271 [Helianthus anomalus]